MAPWSRWPHLLLLLGVGRAWVWPSEAPKDIPFERSSLFREVDFTGKYATYGAADTWFPSWGSDGNLYSPFTDGKVQDVTSASICHGASCTSTTGYATIKGEDPLNLTISDVGVASSSTSPYHGRYPCGSLHVNGTWFYGTYALDNENHQPGDRLGATRGGYCENWCIQGPFIGFRWSKDNGKTWNEPRERLKSWNDTLFGESAPNNHSKVKFGAIHVVDLGKALQYTPAGDREKMMYVIGHGASSPFSPQSWMQGSEIYLARVRPEIQAVNDRSSWDFYGAQSWHKGDVAKAEPLISWANRTGVTTMTYIETVKRYIVCVSTPTYSPFTEQQFDTYLLESENITGPFRYISYLREFGPQAYFVNIPSKFVGDFNPKDGSLRLFLSYSANFDWKKSAPKPAGSGYHWALQEVILRGSHPIPSTVV
ncbi:unnamed protein product [Cladocopium goreaui]|uniref:DUF4185 domain-containing protein n=1 Tax=Cladocopium goreaui TaxID=2562237 RepID=A0A9P1C2D0_9DINO|nr:unnamed protein product [Cladocopium goreaui]